MSPEQTRPRSLRKIEMEVEAEGREWTRQRLQQRLQAEADQHSEVPPSAVGGWCIGAARCNCAPASG